MYRLRVRYAECDMQGHVFNANYLTWFDVAHTEFMRSRGAGYDQLVREHGIEFVVAEATVRYRGAARFDDEVDIEVAPDEPGTTSLVTRFTVRRGEDVLTEGTVRHVCVDAERFTKVPWPEPVRALFTA